MTLVRFRNDHNTDNMIPRTFSEMLDTFFDTANATRAIDRNGMFHPGVDIVEHDNKFEIQVTLPGLKKEEINIELEDNTLTISGERRYENEDKTKKYHLVETRYGKFTRSFTLPRNINRDSIQAAMQDGILSVTIDKSEEAVSRKIEIG
ncbi:heat shock protein Hsp20 [Cyclonatronum proteinivorum]|uniref:Heat shock protein Hsp20 n=1 Tax=Cyclonatronum proteinivorum TaxID=1457365 RepID=A0A345UK13_9BACT|nr:Hsp20/alpha crystallin family protein [Cyclonatronum proteinivorum]AXJ00815.1 heat shock protein Hsp20 [Cyclonatronum proteinivorum]